MTEHFEEYRVARLERGIVDEDTWNMDETGFRIGCGRDHWVMTLHKIEEIHLHDPDNRTYITSAECVSAMGVVIPSMLIFPGILILQRWCQENDLHGGTLLSTSDSGYSNDVLALQWLVHYDHFSKKTQVGAWRMLILDGYGSHLTLEFLDYATEHNIVLFRLPPHSTHKTQPLDVGCFQPFKHYHSEAVDHSVRQGNSEFGKLDFLSAFQEMHDLTFTKSTIVSAWKHTGLVPFNPAIVLDKIIRTAASRQKTPPPTAGPPVAQTPRTSEKLLTHGQMLEMTIEDVGLSTGYLKAVQRFLKGAMAIAHSYDLSELELRVLKSAAIRKAAQKKLSGKVAQKGGVIRVEHVRPMVRKVVEDEEEKARSVIAQAEEKRAREAAKAAERVAIDGRKAERKAKKNAKDLAKAEKLARLASLIDM